MTFRSLHNFNRLVLRDLIRSDLFTPHASTIFDGEAASLKAIVAVRDNMESAIRYSIRYELDGSWDSSIPPALLITPDPKPPVPGEIKRRARVVSAFASFFWLK